MKIMGKYALALLLSCFCWMAIASNSDKAAALFQEQRYEEASMLYAKLLEQNPGSSLYHYRYARCLYELGDYEKSIHHFELSGERYALRNYYMGLLHEATYRFESAAVYYNKYAAGTDIAPEKRLELEERVAQCNRMDRYMQRVEEVSIIDSVVMDKSDFLQAYHLTNEAGMLLQNAEEISHTNQRKDRMFLSRTEEGKTAIYSSEKLLDQWTSPHELPFPVNQGDCSYPYVMSDGITMYYASTHNSMGGYDIFITRYNNTTDAYLNPENIGMPFNSPANDYMMAIDESQGIGWWATDRRQAEGKVVVYSFVYEEEKQYVADEDSLLREKAQLLVYNKAEESTEPLFTTEAKQAEQMPEFSFIIKNQIVYNSYDDFKSEKALGMFQDYQALTDSINEMESQLQSLRQQYQEGLPEERAALTQEILTKERELPTLRQNAQKLAVSIRQEENNLLHP